jgi:hypothetical protein
MTLEEIQALDTSGKLLAPLAGGKLEQNVISLFPPKAGAGTLGQAVKPQTKKLKRLTMAKPTAHKPSRGTNLVADKATKDKLRQDVKALRKQYDGKTADGRLAAIGHLQGFDDTPTVAPKSEIDRLLATGDYIEVWRGVRASYGGPSGKDINEQMRTGPAYYGRGVFGNGYYLATQRRVALDYSDSRPGSMLRALIPKAALTERHDVIVREAHAASSSTSKAKGSYEDGTLYNEGRYAAAKGLDGIEIHHTARAPRGGGAGHVASATKPAYNWLNRSVLIIQAEPG